MSREPISLEAVELLISVAEEERAMRTHLIALQSIADDLDRDPRVTELVDAGFIAPGRLNLAPRERALLTEKGLRAAFLATATLSDRDRS